MKKRILILMGFLLILSILQAQETILSGQISDTLNTPLQNANVLAIPGSQKEQIKFSITNSEGAYKLTLKKVSIIKTPLTINYQNPLTSWKTTFNMLKIL